MDNNKIILTHEAVVKRIKYFESKLEGLKKNNENLRLQEIIENELDYFNSIKLKAAVNREVNIGDRK